MQGVEWGFDGEARLTPLDWEYTGSSLIMNGRLRHTPFSLTRTISLRGHELSLGETVRNVGRERIATMWGSQLTLGGDLLGPGHRARRRGHRGPPRPPVRPVDELRRPQPVAAYAGAGTPWSTCGPCPAPTRTSPGSPT